MGTKKAAKAVVLMVCVAAISTLAACSQASPKTQNVYPEKGYTTVVDGKCDPQGTTTTALTIGGTISVNGTNIKATNVDGDVVVTFYPSNSFAPGAIVNGDVPVTISDDGDLRFGVADFGEITSVDLCVIGM